MNSFDQKTTTTITKTSTHPPCANRPTIAFKAGFLPKAEFALGQRPSARSESDAGPDAYQTWLRIRTCPGTPLPLKEHRLLIALF
jgi:hypothetical protein